MCTALSLSCGDHYFGRNLDLERSYGEGVCVMPRRFPLEFRCAGELKEHFAIIGMAAVIGGYPLYFDAANERGLAMAGLNFPGNACYSPVREGRDNITPFEFIPWLLGQCSDLNEARELLGRINLVDIPFSQELPLSPLHWIISDSSGSIVVEAMSDGLHIHDDPAGVLTNNPPFDYQLFNLNNYRHLCPDNCSSGFPGPLPGENYCRGLGALGLPGDLSSMSRFVRAAFGRANSVCAEDENYAVSQFFHLLGSVEMCRGLCLAESGDWDITVYSACMNTSRGLYYYTGYDNRQICCVDMHACPLDGGELSCFSLVKEQQIYRHN